MPTMIDHVLTRLYGLLPAALILAFISQATIAGEPRYEGKARFEIFGMMDEYMMVFGDTDPQVIERFDPSESAAAVQFEKLLPAYTAEEGISPDFTKKVDSEGFIYFLSPVIAGEIRRHYTKGALHESEFSGAAPEDLLRYVRGAYTRNNYKNAAIINAANSPSKVHNVAACLLKLGCTGVHVYFFNAVPTSDVVIFSPTDIVRQELGIEKNISFADLNKAFENSLKPDDKRGP